MRALVRGLAKTFQDSIKMAPAAEQQPISMAKAREQQQAYVQLLRSLLQEVIELPADDAHPGKSCCLGHLSQLSNILQLMQRPNTASNNQRCDS
jgi:hypothetical protein